MAISLEVIGDKYVLTSVMVSKTKTTAQTVETKRDTAQLKLIKVLTNGTTEGWLSQIFRQFAEDVKFQEGRHFSKM